MGEFIIQDKARRYLNNSQDAQAAMGEAPDSEDDDDGKKKAKNKAEEKSSSQLFGNSKKVMQKLAFEHLFQILEIDKSPSELAGHSIPKIINEALLKYLEKNHPEKKYNPDTHQLLGYDWEYIEANKNTKDARGKLLRERNCNRTYADLLKWGSQQKKPVKDAKGGGKQSVEVKHMLPAPNEVDPLPDYFNDEKQLEKVCKSLPQWDPVAKKFIPVVKPFLLSRANLEAKDVCYLFTDKYKKVKESKGKGEHCGDEHCGDEGSDGKEKPQANRQKAKAGGAESGEEGSRAEGKPKSKRTAKVSADGPKAPEEASKAAEGPPRRGRPRKNDTVRKN